MVDPYWFGGPEKHAKRTQVNTILIFQRNHSGAISERLTSQKALRILEDGRPPAETISELSQPFYNPYMLVRTTDRIEQQKRSYKKLLDRCECYQVNINAGKPKDVQKVVLDIITGRGKEVLR